MTDDPTTKCYVPRCENEDTVILGDMIICTEHLDLFETVKREMEQRHG